MSKIGKDFWSRFVQNWERFLVKMCARLGKIFGQDVCKIGKDFWSRLGKICGQDRERFHCFQTVSIFADTD